MTRDATTYTARLQRVAEILTPHVDLTHCIVGRPDPDELDPPHRFAAMWADCDTGVTKVAVFIEPVDDVKVGYLRADVAGESYLEPGSVTELSGQPTGTHVFLQHYSNAVVAIVDDCYVQLFMREQAPDAAVDIAKTVGCQPYIDDFVQPSRPANWLGWTAY